MAGLEVIVDPQERHLAVIQDAYNTQYPQADSRFAKDHSPLLLPLMEALAAATYLRAGYTVSVQELGSLRDAHKKALVKDNEMCRKLVDDVKRARPDWFRSFVNGHNFDSEEKTRAVAAFLFTEVERICSQFVSGDDILAEERAKRFG